MLRPDPSLEPDWDEDNIGHIARHGLRPEQVEEDYYDEGPFPTLALKNKKKKDGQLSFDIGCGAWMHRAFALRP